MKTLWALYCTVLYCTVLYCTVLYCTALHCLTYPVLHCCTAPSAQVTSIDLPDICRSACFSPNGHLIALGLGTYALCTDSLFLSIFFISFFILCFCFVILYRWIPPSITYRHSLLVLLHFSDYFLLILLILLHCTGGSVRGVNRPSPRPYDGHVVIVSYLQGK